MNIKSNYYFKNYQIWEFITIFATDYNSRSNENRFQRRSVV
jgi:hypothetical protein